MIDLFKTRMIKESINGEPQKLQQIIDDSEYCICVTDPKGYFTAINDNYCKTYEYKREELVGKHFSMVVLDEEKELMRDLHDKFIVNKREISRYWKVKTKAGKILDINVDARWTDQLENGPHKITFVEVNK